MVIGFLCLSFIGFSQRIVDKAVGDFNEVKVYDLIEVNLIKSNENKVLVKGDKAVQIFKQYGWQWGGDWSGVKDYQHFSK